MNSKTSFTIGQATSSNPKSSNGATNLGLELQIPKCVEDGKEWRCTGERMWSVAKLWKELFWLFDLGRGKWKLPGWTGQTCRMDWSDQSHTECEKRSYREARRDVCEQASAQVHPIVSVRPPQMWLMMRTSMIISGWDWMDLSSISWWYTHLRTSRSWLTMPTWWNMLARKWARRRGNFTRRDSLATHAPVLDLHKGHLSIQEDRMSAMGRISTSAPISSINIPLKEHM